MKKKKNIYIYIYIYIRKGKPAYHGAWAGRHPLSKNNNKTFPPAGAAGYMFLPPLRTYSSESVIAPDPKSHPQTQITHTLRCGKGFMGQWLHDTPAAFWRAPSTKAENLSSSARGVVAAGSPPTSSTDFHAYSRGSVTTPMAI